MNLDPDQLLERARKSQSEKIARAKDEFAEEVKHIRWLRDQLGMNGESKDDSTNAVDEPKEADQSEENESGPSGLIREAAIALDKFSADDVLAWIAEKHGRNMLRQPVLQLLSRWTKKRMLDVSEPGRRGKPQVYRATEKLKTI